MAMLKYSDLMIVFPIACIRSGEAAISVDNGILTGTVDMMGPSYVVKFWNDRNGVPDEEYVKEQIRNCKKILDQYKITYKLVKLKNKA